MLQALDANGMIGCGRLEERYEGETKEEKIRKEKRR